MSRSGRLHMPSLAGATEWLNSEPLGPAELRSHVVLVRFWTLTCINWLRQEPYVRAWWRAYREDGLVVVGVHAPEFGFERDVDTVRRAIAAREIDYPVALDNDFAIWEAFANRHWPALYFVDREGLIRDEHFGEGRYGESERIIQRLLGVERRPAALEGVGVEAPADWAELGTPETYLGWGRGERFASQDPPVGDEPRRYRPPERLRRNQWSLAGDWTIGREAVCLQRGGGKVVCRYHARDAHLVLSRSGTAPIPIRVRLDGAAPGGSRGEDVDPDGHGLLDEGRLYQLVRERGAVRDRTLEVEFLEAGAAAYAFTFG